MKKYTVIVIALAALSICACDKQSPELTAPQGMSYSLRLESEAATKASMEGLVTKWKKDDKVAVFHAMEPFWIQDFKDLVNMFEKDGDFVCADDDVNVFTGTLNGFNMVGDPCTWFIHYPALSFYVGDNITSIVDYFGNERNFTDRVQSKSNPYSMPTPMYGIARKVPFAESAPSICMKHVSSFIDVKINNKLDKNVKVTKVVLTAPEEIVGPFDADYSNGTPVFGPVEGKFCRKYSSLTINQYDAVAKDEEMVTAHFGTRPFTLQPGENLVIKVYINDGSTTGVKAFTKSFAEGKRFLSGHRTTFEIDYDSEPADGIVGVTSDDFHTYNAGTARPTMWTGTKTTDDGWKLLRCATFDRTSWEDITGISVCMNGSSATVGQITSPIFAGGLGTLKFKYGLSDTADTNISFRVDIKDKSGTVLKTFNVVNDSPEQKKVYEFSEDINVSGPFMIQISNVRPSGVSRYRCHIFDVNWTAYAG